MSACRCLVPGLLALALGACARGEDRTGDTDLGPAPTPAAATDTASVPTLLAESGPSLYELDLTLVDQDGTTLTLDSFAGRPLVITMFYASCPVACPMLLSDIKHAIGGATPETQAEVAVLLVSLDPERDTPEAMKGLAQRHRRDLPSWRFTRTSPESTRELAAVLGIKYKALEGGAIRHTSLISVLDERGVVRHRATSPVPATDASLPLALNAVVTASR
jgi:protein SCO1